MFRLPKSNGHALGQGRGSASSAHIDAAQQKELGWGHSSFALGFVTYGSLMRDRPSAFYVSDTALFIINVVSGSDPVASMLRRKQDEEKFEVPLSKVVDIKIRKGDIDEVTELPGQTGSYQMTQQAVIRIKGKKDVLYITTTDSIIFAKQLMGTWQELVVCKAAGMDGRLRTNANKELAYEYYREITRSFSHKSATREIRAELLEELADEARCDLEMKSLIFRNRELLVLILDDIAAVLSEPSGFEKELSLKSGLSNITGTSIIQRKIGNIVQKRLAYIRTCLSFLVDVFFCSDAVYNRYQALSTTEPLDPSSWLDILEPDLFVVLAERLKFDVDLSTLDKRGDESARNSRQNSPRDSARNLRRGSSYGSRDDVGKMIKQVSRSSMGTPVANTAEEDTEGYYQRHMNSYQMNKTLDPVLLRTRRSVRDLQHMATLGVYKAMSVGIPGTKSGFGRLHNRVTAARSHMPMGDCWVRFVDFDVNLEHILMRVGSLLDDMLTSEKVKRGLSASGKHVKSRAEAAAIVGAAVTSGAGKRPSIVELLETSTGGKEPSVKPSPGKKTKADRNSGGGEHSPRGVGRRGRDSSPLKEIPAPTKASSPTASVNGTAKKAPFGLTPAVLETQEILLYYTTSLMKALVMDSSKIREVFGRELSSLWPPIMVTLDVICPRGEPPEDADPYADEEARPSAAARLLSCFGSGPEEDPEAAGVDKVGGLRNSEGMIALRGLHDEMVAKRAQQIQLEALPLDCYGPCRIDIPKECWNLLVLSRINIEECMNILNLHGRRKGTNTRGATISGKGDPANGGMLGKSQKIAEARNPMRKRSPRSPRTPRSPRAGAGETEDSQIDTGVEGGSGEDKIPFSSSPALKLNFAGAGVAGAGAPDVASGEDQKSADEKTSLLADVEKRTKRRADRRANAKGSKEGDKLLS